MLSAAAQAGSVQALYNSGASTSADTYAVWNPGPGVITTWLTTPGASTTYIYDPGAPAASPVSAPVAPQLQTPKLARPTPPFARPGTASNITSDAGLASLTVTGLGVSTPKSTTVATSDAWGRGRVETATGIESYGSGAWRASFVPGAIFGTNIAVSYAGTSNIFPMTFPNALAAIGSPYQAWSDTRDPMTFTADASHPKLDVNGYLNGLTLDMSAAVGVGAPGQYGLAGFETRATLTQPGGSTATLYDLTITAPSNFGASDVTVGFQSILGGSYDLAEKSLITSDLNINPTAGTVTLINPITFLATQVDTPSGSYSLSEDNIAAVGAWPSGGGFVPVPEPLPEPSSLVLVASGSTLALLGGFWLHRARNARRSIEGSPPAA
jgi:hypothetical protein